MNARTALLPDSPSEPVLSAAECPTCGSSDTYDFFSVERLPVHVGIFHDTPVQALQAPTGEVTLTYCRQCGFVHNRRFDPGLIHYRPGYEVGLQFSPTFLQFIEEVADRLRTKYDLHGRRIVEIGCGNGFFLRMLCERGGNDGLGFDPTVQNAGEERAGEGRVRFVRDYFSDRYAPIDADFICCLSVFEHIPHPGRFLKMLRSMLGDRRPVLYFEIFNAFEAFRNRETWSIHYEQCNYFSRDALATAFRQAGFDVLEAGTCYAGSQYIYVEAVPGQDVATPLESRLQPAPSEDGIPSEIALFAERYQQKLAHWTERFEQYRRERRKVVVWGTGGKGITFLNSLPTRDVIEYVAEINPQKHGKYIPGSGQLIVPPEFLSEYQPQTIIITNALYEPEMKRQAEQLGVGAEFQIA